MSPMDMPDDGWMASSNLLLKQPHMRFYVQNNWAGFKQDGQRPPSIMSRKAGQLGRHDEEQLKPQPESKIAFKRRSIKSTNWWPPLLLLIPTSQANPPSARDHPQEFPAGKSPNFSWISSATHRATDHPEHLHPFRPPLRQKPRGLPCPRCLESNHPNGMTPSTWP